MNDNKTEVATKEESVKKRDSKPSPRRILLDWLAFIFMLGLLTCFLIGGFKLLVPDSGQHTGADCIDYNPSDFGLSGVAWTHYADCYKDSEPSGSEGTDHVSSSSSEQFETRDEPRIVVPKTFSISDNEIACFSYNDEWPNENDFSSDGSLVDTPVGFTPSVEQIPSEDYPEAKHLGTQKMDCFYEMGEPIRAFGGMLTCTQEWYDNPKHIVLDCDK